MVNSGRTVAQQFLTKSITIPKKTLVTAPTKVAWNLGNVTLNRIDIAFPAGCAFLASVNLVYSSQVIVPWGNPATWIAGNAETVPVVVDFDVDGGLTIQGFNSDPTYAHTIYLRAHVLDNTSLNADTTSNQAIAVTPAAPLTANAAALAGLGPGVSVPTLAAGILADLQTSSESAL